MGNQRTSNRELSNKSSAYATTARADSGSHFVTRDPCHPSFSSPVKHMTRDP